MLIQTSVLQKVLGDVLPKSIKWPKTVEVRVAPSGQHTRSMCGGNGSRDHVKHYKKGAFVESFTGAWGGPNIWDSSSFEIQMSPDTIIIWGSLGHKEKEVRWVCVDESWESKLLDLSDKSTPILLLTPQEYLALKICKEYISSYRKEETLSLRALGVMG